MADYFRGLGAIEWKRVLVNGLRKCGRRVWEVRCLRR